MASNDQPSSSASSESRPPGLTAPIPVEKEAVFYNMEHKERGIALIFNHENFEPHLKLKFHSDQEYKCETLQENLECLGFRVIVHSDLTVFELYEVVSEAAKENHKDRDCLIVVVLTHARKQGCLYAKDDSYNLENLLIPFAADRCPTLAAKPKILIVQASQGNSEVDDTTTKRRTETDSGRNFYNIPAHADSIIVFCDIPGSRFVQALFEELKDKGFVFDLLTILTSVKQQISQNPYIVFQLTRLVRFSAKAPHLVETPSKDEVFQDQNESKTTKERKLIEQLFMLQAWPIHELFYQFNNMISQLSALGQPLNDGMKVCALLIHLPDSMASFKKSVEEMGISDEAKLQILLEKLKGLATISSPNVTSSHPDPDPLVPPLHPCPCTCSSIKENQKYRMDYISKPLAIIIAHKTFEVPMWELRGRKCFKKDIALSKTCFKKLGFEVKTIINKKIKNIIAQLKRVSREDHSNRSCLAIIVSTHGTTNNIIFAKDGPYSINELFEPFYIKNCSTLAGKPKLFFIQACRGDLLQSRVSLVHDYKSLSLEQSKVFKEALNTNTGSQGLAWVKIEDDFLVYFPTTPDHAAFQNSVDGSWLISSLCKIMTDNSTCDILHILTLVNHDIAMNFESNNSLDLELHMKKQMPEVWTKLRKMLVFSE